MTAPRPLDCHELVELVTDYLESVLDDAGRARVTDHLAECDDCAEYLQQFRTTIALLSDPSPAGRPELGAAARDRILTAFADRARRRP